MVKLVEAEGRLCVRRLTHMYNVPRQASVTCVSDYCVMGLGRSVYRDVTQLQSLDSIRASLRRCSLSGCWPSRGGSVQSVDSFR